MIVVDAGMGMATVIGLGICLFSLDLFEMEMIGTGDDMMCDHSKLY